MAFLAKYREFGLLVMRVSLGALFIILTGPVLLGGSSRWAAFGSGIRNIGLQGGYATWGFLGALAVCIGAVLMIFGLFFRLGVLLVLVVTAIHTAGVIDGSMRTALAPLELCAILFGLLLVGPGSYSVDKG